MISEPPRTCSHGPDFAARERRNGLLPYAAAALAACSWGTWPLWLRRAEAMGAMPPALESAIVMAVITAGSGVAMIRDRSTRPASWRARGWVLCLGVTDALNLLLFFAAYRITISVSVLAHYLTPALVAVASPLALRERVTRRTAVAVAISVAGLVAMVGRSGGADPRTAWTSAALGSGSAVFYATTVVVNKLVVDEFTTSEAMFWHGLVATAVLAAFVPPHAWWTVEPGAALFLGAIALGPGALAGLVFLWALRRIPATHASTLSLLEPVVAVAIAAAVVGEVLDARALAGGAMILGASLLVMTQPRDRPVLAATSKPAVGDG